MEYLSLSESLSMYTFSEGLDSPGTDYIASTTSPYLTGSLRPPKVDGFGSISFPPSTARVFKTHTPAES